MGVKEDEETEEHVDDAHRGPSIGARDDCNGSILTLSFQIKAADDKKVYLFWNGAVLPFEASDLHDILPRIFNMESDQNVEFMEKQKGRIDLCEECLNEFMNAQ